MQRLPQELGHRQCIRTLGASTSSSSGCSRNLFQYSNSDQAVSTYFHNIIYISTQGYHVMLSVSLTSCSKLVHTWSICWLLSGERAFSGVELKAWGKSLAKHVSDLLLDFVISKIGKVRESFELPAWLPDLCVGNSEKIDGTSDHIHKTDMQNHNISISTTYSFQCRSNT